METKHTPGPWLAASGPSSVVGWPVVGEGGRLVCNVAWQKKPGHVSAEEYGRFSEQCGANAYLIAAAPELFEALALVITALASDECHKLPFGNRSIVLRPAAIADIRAALAKASGR